jgi:Ribonuclease G/E
MIFPINGSQELIIVTVVKTYYDPRVVNTQFLHLNGKTCPTCGGRGHV